MINSDYEIFEELMQAGVEINYLINNAVFCGYGNLYERSWEQDLARININVIALLALSRFILPLFIRRNEGKILNVSSTSSLLVYPLEAVNYATKSYVTSFSNPITAWHRHHRYDTFTRCYRNVISKTQELKLDVYVLLYSGKSIHLPQGKIRPQKDYAGQARLFSIM